MTRLLRQLLASGCMALAAGCASTVARVQPTPTGPEQHVSVATYPAGAACELLQVGTPVASIGTTPGTVAVSRDFCRGIACAQPEGMPRLEVACRKEGYLERRMSFPVAWAFEVAQEAGGSADAAGGNAAAVAAGVATRAAAQAAFVAAPPLGVGLMAFAVGSDVAYQSEHPTFPYAYRPLPEIVLVPATFGSDAACGAFFDEFATRLMAERDAERARIDRACRPWPCSVNELACPNPLCERQRVRADADLKARLDEMLQLRIAACAIVSTGNKTP